MRTSPSPIVPVLLLGLGAALAASPAPAADWTFIRVSNTGILGAEVTHLAMDPADRLWVAARDPFNGEGGVTWTEDLLHWTTYSSFDTPLTSDRVYAIAFAAPHDVWMATNDGLAHLHEESWTIYRASNSPLPASDIRDVTIDEEGAVWAIYLETGTSNSGLARFDGVAWTIWDDEADIGFGPGARLDELAIDTLGRIWVDTRGGGIAHYDGSTWTLFNASTGYSDSRSDELMAGPDGDVFVDWYLGMMRFDGTTWSELPEPTTQDISMVHPAGDGTYWCGTFGGALYRPTGPDTWEGYDFEDRVVNLVQTSTGDIWVGGIRHVARFDSETLTFTDLLSSDNTGFPRENAQAFARETDGTMWTGTQGGGVAAYTGTAGALDEGVWRGFNPWNLGREPWPFGYDGDYGSDSARDVLVDDAGDVWIASNGLARWNGSEWTRYTPEDSGLWGTSITCLGYGDGTLWVGYEVTGVDEFDGDTWVHHGGGGDAFPPGGADDIVVDTLGRVWAATGSQISLYDGTTWVTDPFGPMPGQVFRLAAGPAGDLWVGTTNGLLYYDGVDVQTFTVDDSGIPANNLKDIFIASDGSVWVAAWFSGVGGVARYDGTSWTTYLASSSPLRHYQVTAIGEDADGNIWIGTESEGINVILNPSVVSAAGPPVVAVNPARVVPHPFRGRATLSMTLTEPGPVSVRVYDVGGREVHTARLGWRPAGEVEVTIPGAGLVPGVYLYEAKAAHARFRGRLVRVE
jgi:ligand-binding sensor domain-containing protein